MTAASEQLKNLRLEQFTQTSQRPGAQVGMRPYSAFDNYPVLLGFCEKSGQSDQMNFVTRSLRRIAADITGHCIRLLVRFLTAVRADWKGIEPVPKQRVYFSNHTSNGDMPMIWACLPPALRREVRPVAAADYWLKNKLRAFVGPEVFNCVLVDRRPEVNDKPMDKIIAALDDGSSLIIFPEGKRNMTDEPLLPFRAGLYNMGLAHPDVDLVPTWIANLNEIMPKGEIIPLPLICTVTFGEPIRVRAGESKEDFLRRAQAALLAQKPEVRE